jgi:hypothetical protein
VDEALVEDAEDDVDGEERECDEDGLGGERLLIGLRGALETAVDGGMPILVRAFSTAAVACESETLGARLNESVVAGESD